MNYRHIIVSFEQNNIVMARTEVQSGKVRGILCQIFYQVSNSFQVIQFTEHGSYTVYRDVVNFFSQEMIYIYNRGCISPTILTITMQPYHEYILKVSEPVASLNHRFVNENC